MAALASAGLRLGPGSGVQELAGSRLPGPAPCTGGQLARGMDLGISGGRLTCSLDLRRASAASWRLLGAGGGATAPWPPTPPLATTSSSPAAQGLGTSTARLLQAC